MRVALLLVFLGAASAQNASSSTGVAPPMNASSTGMASSTGPAGGSSSTGAAESSSTGPAPPVVCEDVMSCGSCYDNGCVWCPTSVGNSTKCLEAGDADSCPIMATALPDPLNKINVVQGKDMCELETCVADLNAGASMLKVISEDLIFGNVPCVVDFLTCQQTPGNTYCEWNCDLAGLSQYKSNCTNDLPNGPGKTCDYFINDTTTTAGPNGTNTSLTSAIQMPYCVPSSCDKSVWFEVFMTAYMDFRASEDECQAPNTCQNEGFSFACTDTPADDSGLSTGAVVGIVAGSLVGLALMCYCGQQACKSGKSEYEAF